MLTEPTRRAAVHAQKWFENWKLTKSKRKKRWHKFSWKSEHIGKKRRKKRRKTPREDGCVYNVCVCVHFACCCSCSGSMRISVATRHFVLAKIWGWGESSRQGEKVGRGKGEWRATAGHQQRKACTFLSSAVGLSCFHPPSIFYFPPAFECLTCHLPASECRHATRPAAKICKLDIKNALMKIPPAAEKKTRKNAIDDGLD